MHRKIHISQIITCIINSGRIENEITSTSNTLITQPECLRVIFKENTPIISYNNLAVWDGVSYSQREIEGELYYMLRQIKLGKRRDISKDQKDLIKQAEIRKLGFPTILYVSTSLDNAFKLTLAYWKYEIFKENSKNELKISTVN
tara:strand:+ start:1902 stop:2336 length:435 start_codon:yes stop_codon:yes gene_type:complete